MLKLGKSVSWGEISEMAGDWDKAQKRERERSNDLNARFNKLYVNAVQEERNPSWRKEVRPGVHQAAVGQKCSYCSKPGHQVSECWQRLGMCFVCGSAEHRLRDCPKHWPRVSPMGACSYCQKTGHQVSECWRRLGKCLLCGSSEHRLRVCPRHRS